MLTHHYDLVNNASPTHQKAGPLVCHQTFLPLQPKVQGIFWFPERSVPGTNETVPTWPAHHRLACLRHRLPNLREHLQKRKPPPQLCRLIFSSWNASVSGLDRNRPPPLVGPCSVPLTALETHPVSHPAPRSCERKKKLARHHKQVDTAQHKHQPRLAL